MLTPPAVTPLVLDSSNEALSAFALASAVLGTKLVFNSSFTIYHRVKRQASLLCLYLYKMGSGSNLKYVLILY